MVGSRAGMKFGTDDHGNTEDCQWEMAVRTRYGALLSQRAAKGRSGTALKRSFAQANVEADVDVKRAGHTGTAANPVADSGSGGSSGWQKKLMSVNPSRLPWLLWTVQGHVRREMAV